MPVLTLLWEIYVISAHSLMMWFIITVIVVQFFRAHGLRYAEYTDWSYNEMEWLDSMQKQKNKGANASKNKKK